MKNLKIVLLVILVDSLLIGSFAAWVFVDNTKVAVSTYAVYSEKLPEVFDNYKIALITDFHDSNNYQKVIAETKQMKPNIIVIVGDLINMGSTDYKNAGKLLDGLVTIAPTYYTYGNHEVWSNNQKNIYDFAVKKGVTILNDEVFTLKYENDSINIIGSKDIGKDDWHMKKADIEKNLKTLYAKIPNKDLFNVLLFHRANYFDTISKYPFDLVLSGHLHNGQINLPFIQKWLLKMYVNNDTYSKGIYRKNASQMIVSGGVEKNLTRPRICNTPEVVDIILHTMEP